MKELEVIDSADQQFGSIFNNRRVTLRLRYNPTNDRWAFDLSLDDLPVIRGRRIVTGVDLLATFNFDIGRLYAIPFSAEVADRNTLPLGMVRLYQIEESDIADLKALGI